MESEAAIEYRLEVAVSYSHLLKIFLEWGFSVGMDL